MTTNDTSWLADAICKGRTDLFFSATAREAKKDRLRRESIAMTYCQQCPVRIPCRDYGRENNELGIWGGENEEMRWRAGFLRNAISKKFAKKYAKETHREAERL